MSKVIRVGMMPGKIEEVAVEDNATVQEVLSLVELDASGYDVKLDSEKVTDLNQPVGDANLILLAKQVKGNATVRIGMMPGRINEYALEETTTVQEALNVAELDASGYDVKIDGEKVTNLDRAIGSSSLILLAKQVKGNK